MQNGTLICTDTAGGRVWQRLAASGPSGPGSSGTGGGSNPPADGSSAGGGAAGTATESARVGEPCATPGRFGFGDGMVTVCAGNAYRYALPRDLPPAPAGGYAQRPAWYPTLGQIFGPTVDECRGGPVRFDRPFVDPAKLSRSMPAGMTIYDHVTPIDHMYVGITALDRPESERAADAATLTAPGDGTVIEVSSLGSPTSHRVVVVHGCGVVSVFMVVNHLSGVLAPYADRVESERFVALSLPVKAGDELGTQTDNPIDFNLFDGAAWLPHLANPFSYAEGEPWKPYTVDPFPYFTGGAADALRASIQRTAEPRWGVIDHDVIGSAAGSWFLDGTIGYNGLAADAVQSATAMIPGGSVPGKTFSAWGHLALTTHGVDTSAWVFSTGWWNDDQGDPKQVMLDRSADQPAPDGLTASSGPVAYALTEMAVTQPAGWVRPASSAAPDGIGYTLAAGQPVGWVLVQVVDDSTLAVEISTDPARRPTAFTTAKRTYHR